MRRFLPIIVAAVLAACQASDASGPSPDDVARLAIVPSPANVQLNQTLQLTAVPLNFRGDTLRGRTATWRIDDGAIASLSTAGVAHGLQAGHTTVRATVDGVEASTKLTVSGFSPIAVVSDDFRTYANTQDFLHNTGRHNLYSVATNADLAAIDEGVRYDGHHTLKLTQPAGAAVRHQTLFPYFGRGLSEFWMRAKMRFSPGWTPGGESDASATLIHWGWQDPIGYRGSLDVSRTEFRLYWFADGGVAPVSASAGSVGTALTGGEWYDVIVHYEPVGAGEARTRLWLARDGETPQLRGSITGRMSSGAAPAANRLQLAPELAGPPAADQAVWYGQWQVVDGTLHANPFNLPDA